MRRQFRPSLGRSQPDKKGDAEIPTTSNETLTAETPPTRRARIKPRVRIVGNNRNGGPVVVRSQPKLSAAVVPSIVTPLVPEKEVNNLPKNSTELSGVTAGDVTASQSRVTHRETTRDVGGDGTQGCTMAELEDSTLCAQEKNLSSITAGDAESEVSLQDKIHRETTRDVGDDGTQGCTMAELDASTLCAQENNLSGITAGDAQSEVSLQDKMHRETTRDVGDDGSQGCTMAELEASTLCAQEKNLSGITAGDAQSEVSLQDKMHRETTRDVGDDGTQGCTMAELDASTLCAQENNLSGIMAGDAESEVSLQDKIHRETTRDVGGDGSQGCTMAELEASTLHAQEKNLSGITAGAAESEVSLQDKMHGEARDVGGDGTQGCTMAELEASTLHAPEKNLSGITAGAAESEVSLQDKMHGEARDVGGDGTQGCTMAELDASTLHAQENNLSSPMSTQSKEDTRNVHSSGLPSAKPVFQVEPYIASLIEKSSLLLEGNTASDSLQSTGRSNVVVEENTPEFTGSITEATVDSQLSNSNVHFNADDFLQNLLQNNNSCSNEHSSDAGVITDVMADLHQSLLGNSEAAAEPQLLVTNKLPENIASYFEKRFNPQTESHSNVSNVITEVMADSQQSLSTCSGDSALPISNNQSEKVTGRIDSDSTIKPSNRASGTSSRLNVKRRRKPKNKFPPQARQVDVALALEFSDSPQMLDITDIPIASVVEIDLDLCDSGTPEIDHPVLELPNDLIQDDAGEECPQERQAPKVSRQRFGKKKLGTVKRVISRPGLRGLKESTTAQGTSCEDSLLESETVADGKEKRKEEAVKKKKVGPNLTQARRTRDRLERTPVRDMLHRDGDIRRSDLDEVENHDGDNVVEVISECIQVEDRHGVRIPECNEAENEDSVDIGRISECYQAEGGDSLTDVVKIPECSQAEAGDSLTDVVKIPECSQVEAGDSLTDVVKVPECCQAELQCSVTALPASSNILEDISLMCEILNHNSNPLECPYTDIVTSTTGTTRDVTNDTHDSERTSFRNRTPEDNSTVMVTIDVSSTVTDLCISDPAVPANAEACSRSNETEKQPKTKGIRGKRKTKGKQAESSAVPEGSEVAQGVTEGLQESQDIGDPAAVSEGSDSVTCGKKRKLSKPKPKIPAKRGRKKATSKEPANVTEETATAEHESGTDGPIPTEEGETSTPPSEKTGSDSVAPQKRKRGRPPSSKTSTDTSKQKDNASTETVTKKKSKRQTRSDDLPAVNISTMKISAMAYYNPKTNPMKSPSIEETQENTRVQSPSTQASQPEIILAESEGEGGEQPAILAPQVRIDADGNVVLDEESLLISTSAAANSDASDREVVYESANRQYRSTMKRKYMDRWNKEETLHFYEVLSQIGTDFSLMATLFPKRNRTELKKKFKKEEKQNRDLIEKALNQRNPIPAYLFAELLEETEEDMDQSLAVSPQENPVQAGDIECVPVNSI